LGDARNLARSAERLVGEVDDATAQWLVARWAQQTGESGQERAARARLEILMHADTTRPLARSLWLDLAAHDSLAGSDTAAALRTWRRAVERFDVERVSFGLVGSLWPLQLDRAHLAAAREDHDEVIAATTAFELSVGYNDQVAWWVALPLRAHALEQKGDVLGARNLRLALTEVWSDANGAAAQVLERLRPGGNP
jgi:hypothetical protein